MKSHSKLPPKSAKRTAAVKWYEQNAEYALNTYESISFQQAHKPILELLPNKPGTVLDVGSGSGRDAAGLAALGHQVIAVEPNGKMRNRAMQLHRSHKIHWLDDSLPKLKKVRNCALTYDCILLSGVWMHVSPNERRSTFRRLVSLLTPGGMMCLTFRHGLPDLTRGFWEVRQEEVLQLARDFGLFATHIVQEDDLLCREGVSWTRIILRSPGDGTGSLPLLRGIILNDNKSSTYKLALLRVLVRISQSAGGLARLKNTDHVELPLGLFALYWLRLYRPLLEGNLPQLPANISGGIGVGFAKKDFQNLHDLSVLDFRVGARFQTTHAKTVHQALRVICATLTKMPMHYTTYPGSSEQVFVARKTAVTQHPQELVLNSDYLFSFGSVRIPYELWQSSQKFGAWIEPAIIAEWKVLMKRYAQSQGRVLEPELIDKALVWSEPKRDTALSRDRALNLHRDGVIRHCVWSGKKLSSNSIDIDHCFPYSAWPCDDLWNLLPTSRTVNQNSKREKLPSLLRLNDARERILNWWDCAYLQDKVSIQDQFFTEVAASLRLDLALSQDLDEVFDSVSLQQTQLKFNQQIPEWNDSG